MEIGSTIKTMAMYGCRMNRVSGHTIIMVIGFIHNYGWTWASDYNWGWAPFHYGRWLYDDAYGWMWVPGYEWAPAWVSWRNGGGCYGWAPLGPGGNFDISIGSRIPYNYWAFVPHRYINNPRINNYYINQGKKCHDHK